MSNVLDTSLNTSKKRLFCNHCMHDLNSYEEMKEHYSSEFHKYNLNRVTMNFNPLTYPEYIKKKEKFQALQNLKPVKTQIVETLTCDVCKKTFSSHNKREEHYKSKSHIALSKKEPMPIEKEIKPIIYTKEDHSVCLFCNYKSENLHENINHMVKIHKFEVPFPEYIKNLDEMIKLIIQKLFDYEACLSCDLQGFKNFKSLQNHMLDTNHTYVNNEDLEEFLYKYYDKKKLFAIKEKSVRKTKEFQILKAKLKKKEGEEEEEDSDYDDNVVLPSGEMLTSTGNIIGNKVYALYYKQGVRVNKYERLISSMRKNLDRKKIKKKRAILKDNVYSLKGSNQGMFRRINTLFKTRKQVNV